MINLPINWCRIPSINSSNRISPCSIGSIHRLNPGPAIPASQLLVCQSVTAGTFELHNKMRKEQVLKISSQMTDGFIGDESHGRIRKKLILNKQKEHDSEGFFSRWCSFTIFGDCFRFKHGNLFRGVSLGYLQKMWRILTKSLGLPPQTQS